MDLREFLFRKRMTVTEFSKQLDCNRSYLSDIMHGSKKPGKRLAKEIERLTDGQVKAEDLSNIREE